MWVPHLSHEGAALASIFPKTIDLALLENAARSSRSWNLTRQEFSQNMIFLYGGFLRMSTSITWRFTVQHKTFSLYSAFQADHWYKNVGRYRRVFIIANHHISRIFLDLTSRELVRGKIIFSFVADLRSIPSEQKTIDDAHHD